MKPLQLENIYAGGEILHRAMLNFDRLEQTEYQPPQVFQTDPRYGANDWPGDFEGRTMLALVMLARATHRDPLHLDQILAGLPGFLNEKGYLGAIVGGGNVNEQQMSGHSWLLRGLCEHYAWKQDSASLAIIESIANNLFIPTRDAYAEYPLHRKAAPEGEASGSITGELCGRWYCSTDVGCAFIPLDGATRAYEILHDDRLRSLIDTMIEVFVSADVRGQRFQTHATLSGVRGLLRHYDVTGDSQVLEAAKRIYGIYLISGMTENYENYNWFGRPEWTEPCAFVDSYMAAVELWRHTGDPAYLDDAHHIYYNAMGYNQRPTGGWGTNECSGAHDEFLQVGGCYEATWCCCMRGGDGLGTAISHLCFADGSGIALPFHSEGTLKVTFADGEAVIGQTTGYPIEGSVRLEVISSDVRSPKRVRMFVPGWVEPSTLRLSVNGEKLEAAHEGGFVSIISGLNAGDRIELGFDIAPRTQTTINPNSIKGCRTFRHGPLILGVENQGVAVVIPESVELASLGRARYAAGETGAILSPINDLVYRTDDAARRDRRQILFRG